MLLDGRAPTSLALLCLACVCVSSASGGTEAQDRSANPPVILDFAINSGAASVLRSEQYLTATTKLSGANPVEFRISARPDFAGVDWKRFSVPLRVRNWSSFVRRDVRCESGAAGHQAVVYLQVRADLGSTLRVIAGQRVMVPQKAESNVVTDTICVTG